MATFDTITLGGKEYVVDVFDSAMVREFEKWAKSEAWREVQEMREFLSADEYGHALSAITVAIGGKEFRIGGAGFDRMEKCANGIARKVWLMIRGKAPEVTWQQVQQWQDDDFNATQMLRITEARAKLTGTDADGQ